MPTQFYRYFGEGPGVRTASDIPLRVQPDDPALRQMVLTYLKSNAWQCRESCVALDLGGTDGRRDIALVSGSGYERVSLPDQTPDVGSAKYQVPPRLGPSSKVEIREVPKRYIFVDGKPVGPPLD